MNTDTKKADDAKTSTYGGRTDQKMDTMPDHKKVDDKAPEKKEASAK